MAVGRLALARVLRPSRAVEAAPRFERPRDAVVFGAVSLTLLLVPLVTVIETWPRAAQLWGVDFNLYLDAAARWLAGGPYYPPEQLSGPLVDDGQRILYPPTALWLFAPLSLLPRDLAGLIWWVFPLTALGLQVDRFRPRPIVWPFIAICLAWPPTILTVVVWNSAPLFVGFLALSTMNRWTSALILLKPSVLPFAFWGAADRRWWITFCMLVALSLPFGSLWLEWLQVVSNSAAVGGIWHSVQQFPMFAIPILVWLGRSRSA